VTDRESPPLFDLPLFKEEGEGAGGGATTRPGARSDTADEDAGSGGEPAGGEANRLPLAEAAERFPFDFDDEPAAEPGTAATDAVAYDPHDDPTPAADLRPRPAPLLPRLGAALLDGGVLLTVASGAVVGSFLIGIRWQLDDLPPLGLFLAVFSFLYSAVPLAFWGRTPGMALMRLTARSDDGGPLTFGQTALRWSGGLLTLLLAGLPLLLAAPPLGGRSLADRLSASRCWLETAG